MTAASLLDTVVGGCYRLTRALGEGGMGTIYEAQHLRLGGKVAIKILSPQHAADPKFRERFRREARAASQIRHPNVVQITDFGDTPSGSVFLAMELLEGHDLHYVMRKHAPTPFPWVRAVHLVAQAADALAATHRCGVVHRDVKPSNIFVLEGPGLQDFVKLLDFGIAKIVIPSADSALVKNLTGTGEIFGTAKYMAPEQAYGGASDPRMDVYSLGVVAYELLTGRVPFTGQSNFEIVTRHVYDQPQPLRELRPELPVVLEAVVLRAMAKTPEDRFATMEAFGQALRQVGGTGTRTGTIGSVPRARAHTDTNENTMPRSRKKLMESIEPTTFHAPKQPLATVPAAPPEAPTPVPVRGQTVPAFAAHAAVFLACAPEEGTTSAEPAGFVPTQAPVGPASIHQPPSAPAPVLPPTQQPPRSPVRDEAPTGSPAPHSSSDHDDTSRDVARGFSAGRSGTWQWMAFAAIAALVVASASTMAVALWMGAEDEEPRSAPEELATRPEPQPIEEPPSAPQVPPSTVIVPVVEIAGPGDAEAEDIVEEPAGAEADSAGAVNGSVTTTPALGTPRVNDSPKPTKARLPSKSQPRTPAVPPTESDDDTTRRIGREIGTRIKRACHSLGDGRVVMIVLSIGDDGRIYDKTIDAKGALRSCIEKSIGSPRFPRKKSSLKLAPWIGGPVDPFAESG
jgi:serine/threonine protein kinase